MAHSGERFGSNEHGEHDWEATSSQSFVRVRCGWHHHNTVAMILVGQAIDGSKYVSAGAQRALKTRDHYGASDDNVALHCREDYLKFMGNMIEAGKRAGFITEDEAFLMEPPKEESW